jgi:hypothetical protein
MRLLLICCAAAPSLLASPAIAAGCDDARVADGVVAAYGEQASIAQNYVLAGDAAANARIPAIDAAHHAKACGCKEALPPLEDATITARRANVVLNLDGARGYGARIKKDADEALEALRKCAARG